MVDLKEIKENNEGWKQVLPEESVMPLDHLERDGVSIQCVNSSEFVVGKQTNFNGPVTIINCENAYTDKFNVNEKEDKEKVEKVVIREKVLSKSANMKLQQMATENSQKSEKLNFSEKLKFKIKIGPLFPKLLLPVAILIIIAATTAIILTVISRNSQIQDSNNQTCITVPKLSREACIYSMSDMKKCNKTDRNNTTVLQHPVPFVVISQTGGDSCFNREECLEKLQKYKCKEQRPKCNFLVTPEGHFYEDGGWNGTNSLEGPAAGRSLMICFVGSYSEGDYPTYPQIESAKILIQHGVETGYVAANYYLIPGNVTNQEDKLSTIYKIIKKWKNFNETVFNHSDNSAPPWFFGATRNGLIDFPLKPKGNRVSYNERIAFVVCGPTVSSFGILPAGENGTMFIPKPHVFYTKKDWGGQPPTSKIEMKNPVPYVFISHTVTPECYNLSTCAIYLRSMQDYHFSRSYADISYNFLVDSKGNIYEGRGWSTRNVKSGFENGRNLDIAFIGDFSKRIKPKEDQLAGVQFLIDFGVTNGKIAEDYVLVPSNATFSTLSPGKHVYEAIKKWPHFDANPQDKINY